MPTGVEIQQYMAGVWRLMMGRPDGVRWLDLSADGFWNSFFAILVAIPPLMVGWVGVANDVAGDVSAGVRFALLVRLFLVDVGAWLIPLAMLAAVAGPAGISDRFVHYVVATNWASAFFAWLLAPAAIMRLFFPVGDGIVDILALVLFLATLFLSWRLTTAVIDKGPALGSAVFFAMLAASVATLVALQSLLGLTF
ncbi:transporter [Nitratireductor luteus]|uniref:transporter n=1 Tax=Nitratireductor luteus TaxID=2976980 RepID=UPI00223EC140|nr:transporter [Nitratireductor luteus]